MMCAILACVFVLFAVWIKCQDLKLFIEREPLHSYLIALLLAWSLLISFWSSLPFALVLHLYLFEHGVLSYFWRKALMLHLDLFESLWNFVERLSCFTYTFWEIEIYAHVFHLDLLELTKSVMSISPKVIDIQRLSWRPLDKIKLVLSNGLEIWEWWYVMPC
jgi:hypothetical protein